MNLQDMCDRVCRDLPDGWLITIDLMRDSGDVTLWDPNGDKCEFPSNRETIEQQLIDALEAAIELDAEI